MKTRKLQKDENFLELIPVRNPDLDFKKDEKGQKEYNGSLTGYNENEVFIDEVPIERKNIAQIRTIYNW